MNNYKGTDLGIEHLSLIHSSDNFSHFLESTILALVCPCEMTVFFTLGSFRPQGKSSARVLRSVAKFGVPQPVTCQHPPPIVAHLVKAG